MVDTPPTLVTICLNNEKILDFTRNVHISLHSLKGNKGFSFRHKDYSLLVTVLDLPGAQICAVRKLVKNVYSSHTKPCLACG